VFEGFRAIYVVYAAAALTGIMIAEGCYLLYAGRSDKRTAINRRMKLQENKISQEQVLIQLRKERGLTLRSLVAQHGFHLTQIQRIEKGNGVSVPTLLRLAEAFQIPVETLIAGLGLVGHIEKHSKSSKE